MIDYYFELKDFSMYLFLFVPYLLLLVLFFHFGKIGFKKNKLSFYGMFMELSIQQIISISFLFLFFYIVIASIFVNSFSVFFFILLLIPIILFNVFHISFFHILFDIVNVFIIYFILISKSIFFHYIQDVASYWYVICLYVILCIFIFLYVSYISLRRLKFIISKNKYLKLKC